MIRNSHRRVGFQNFDVNLKYNQMHSLLPELFLATSILILLVYGGVLAPSPYYNYPLLNFHGATLFILVFFIYLEINGTFGQVQDFFVQDSLALGGKVILAFSLIACLAVSKNYFTAQRINAFEYFVLILFGFLGLCLLISSNDFLALYISLELQSLAFYVLAAFQRKSAFSTEAGLKYFLLGAISSGFLLLGISYIYGLTGTTSFAVLSNVAEGNNIYLCLALVLFSVGLLFKLGVAPFHMWVPDAYEGSPTSITIIFASIPKLAIITVLWRVLHATFPCMGTWQILLIGLGVFSILIGSLLALKQNKVKRLLAYSGISHVGYAIISLGCGNQIGIQACLLYIIVYMLTSIYLWGLVLHLEANNKNRTRYLVDFIQLFETNPILGWTSILVIFSLAGIPPLGGFFAKLGVFIAVFDASFYFIGVLALLFSAISIIYYLGLIKNISIEKRKAWTSVTPLSKPMAWAIGISAFTLIFFVFFADFFYLVTYNIALL